MSLNHVLGGLRFFRHLRLFLIPGVFALLAPLVIGYQMHWKSEAKERYQKQYGDSWTSVYEREVGPVHEEPLDIAINIGGCLIMLGLGVFVYIKMIPPGAIKPVRPRRSRLRSHHRPPSQ